MCYMPAHREGAEPISAGTTSSARHDADPLGERLRRRAQSLSPAARRVLELIDRNRATALASSAAELAAMAGTSDATVVRAVQALGFSGLPDLKQALAATLDARATPADAMRDTLEEVGPRAEHAVELVLETHREAMRSAGDAGGARAHLGCRGGAPCGRAHPRLRYRPVGRARPLYRHSCSPAAAARRGLSTRRASRWPTSSSICVPAMRSSSWPMVAPTARSSLSSPRRHAWACPSSSSPIRWRRG